MPISIRQAGPADAEAVGAVHVRGWQWGYRGQLPDALLAGLDAGQRASRWREIMTAPDPTATVVVAESNGSIVGFASCGPTRDPDGDNHTGEVYAIYVEEESAGTGAGTALLQAVIDDLWARGFHDAMLWVLETNARARRFYEREGWHADGATKSEDFEGFTLHEVRYVLTR
jgi:L-amino acid N-acyltransferase YncA